MICYDVFRGIDTSPRFWKFEGGFIVFALILVILSTALIVFIPSWILKIFIIIVVIISLLIFQHLSEKHGVKGVKKIIGGRKQPRLIIIIRPQFELLKSEDFVSKQKK